MANIRIDLGAVVVNGQDLTFKSPVDCSQVTGLILYYPEGGKTTSKTFKFVDAHGVDVGSGTISLFAADALVKVVLDTDDGKAYVQNADTNAYIEETFTKRIKLWENPSPYSAFDAQELSLDLSGYDGVEVVYFADDETQSLCNTGFIPTDWRYFAYGVSSEITFFVYPINASRQFTFYKNKIEFYNAITATLGGAGVVSGQYNNYLVPYQIYGIKGVKK